MVAKVNQRPGIWAFGSGKGGVGKSLVTANVAVTLIRHGHSCVLIDADLGGANLHTLVGAGEAERTLSDFLSGDVAHLREVLAPTPIPGLSLISGARARHESPHLEPSQRQQLLRELSSLPFEYVLLDLATGSTFNTLDLFLAAEQRALVVTPEPTAVENAYHFLKAAFYHRLEASGEEAGVEAAVKRAMQEQAARGIKSPRQLIAEARAIDPDAGGALEGRLEDFRPRLILNQVRSPAEARLGKEMTLACRDYLRIEVDYLGAIAFDDTVRRAVHERKPSRELFPTSPFSSSIQEITDRLLESTRPAAPRHLLSEDFRVLGLEPGCRLADVIDAHKRLKELYSQPSLATYSEVDEERRTVMLGRIEEASRRILMEVSGAIPLAET